MTSADPRDHLVLVLDVERLDDALAYAERMSPWFGIVKVGYELYGAAGPEAFDALHHKGFRVFADLKLHDIPTTVERGARAIGRHGVEFLNFHAAGGETMLRAGLDGLRDGVRDADTRNRSRSRSPCSRATRMSMHSSRRMETAAERRFRRRRVRRSRHRDRARTQPAHDGSRHPACPVAMRTIRHESTRRAMPSRAVPTGSSSAVPWPRPTTRNERPKRLRATSPPRSPAHRVDRLHEKVACVY